MAPPKRQSGSGGVQASTGVDAGDPLTKQALVWIYRQACIFGQQILWFLGLALLMGFMSNAPRTAHQHVLHNLFSLRGLALGMPLGVFVGVLHSYQWRRSARSLNCAARNAPWLWLLNLNDKTRLAPDVKAPGIAGGCLMVLLFLGTPALSRLVGEDAWSVWLGELIGWVIAWDAAYLAWWSRLPPQ